MAGCLARLWHGPPIDFAKLQHQALRSANLELLKLLVDEAGPALNMDDFGLLSWDIVRNTSPQMRDTLRYLITTCGLSPNATFPVYPGANEHTNLLQRACHELNIDMVELLLQQGADAMCPGLEQGALHNLVLSARTMSLNTSRYADCYMPLVTRLREAGCPDVEHLDFSRRKYRHPAVSSVQTPGSIFESDYAWPHEDVPVNRRPDHVSWVEETGNSFSYHELLEGQIRLVKLQPSFDPSDPIDCMVIHTPIDEAPAYEILSIPDDCSTATLPITIGGKTLEVPHAVWDALHRVRRPDGPRLLWVEAVSINSDDLEESARRIELRSAVYPRARRALAWLGATDQDSQLVFFHLDQCRASRKLNWAHYKGSTQDAFHKLCRRSWFHQVESAHVVALSKSTTIFCGDDGGCDLRDLLRCTSFRQDYHPLHGIHGPNQLYNLEAISYHAGEMEVMRFARSCQPTDLEDMALQLASITRAQDVLLVPLRTGAGGVARSFAQHAILRCRSLSILHYGSAGLSRLQDGPSWVPDFASPTRAAPLPRVFGSHSYRSSHPWLLQAEPQFHDNGDLTLEGVFCGKVQAVGEPLSPISSEMTPGTKQFRKVLRSWEVVATSHLSNNGRKRFSHSVADAFADTIRAYDDAEQVGEARPSITDRACDFVAWYRQHGSGVLSSKEAAYFDNIETITAWQSESRRASGEDNSRGGCSVFTEDVERAIFGRRFFVTDDGSMGLAPIQSKAGDRLVFFQGGLYPWVVRARPDGRTYELIGDCYLYDFKVVDVFSGLSVEALRDITLN